MFGDACVCETCGRHYVHDWHKGHRATRCNSCCANGWRDRRELKQRMVDYKGGACVLCGYSKCLRAMDFHHLDPSSKRFNIASSHNRRWEALRLELDKCMLICSNCHFELEADTGRRRARRDDPDADSTCDRCGRRFRYRRAGMTRSRCNSCCQSRATPGQRRELKEWMVDYKGGACVLCGYRRHTRALTFHHVDPMLKRFNIAPSHNRSLEALRDELDRCILLCANCHDEIEDGSTDVPAEAVSAVRTLTEHLPRLERRPQGRPRQS
jgi:hypothetical protein